MVICLFKYVITWYSIFIGKYHKYNINKYVYVVELPVGVPASPITISIMYIPILEYNI